jgi:hypothetical protein
MADSTITQLPLSPYILDKDLMVVVTGHLEDGAFPRNKKIPLSYIRKYIVRLNLISNQVSGIDSYYNSGLNILTTWTTGLHAVPGNNIEIQFSQNTPAGGKYGGTGPICHSGIISTTGLNSVSENLIKIDYNNNWPYSGIIYHTGLNARAGNNIEINFSSTGNAHNQYGGAGGKYSSGIISVTGSNISDGNGIGYNIETSWPYKFNIFNTEKIKYATSSTTIYNNDTYPNSTTAKYNILTLNYNDFYFSKTNQTLSLVGTAVFKISSIAFGGRPYVPGQGSLNTQKLQELLPLSGVTYGYSYITCDSTVCPGSGTGVYAQNTNYTTVTWNDTHLANFVSDAEYDYIINSFTLNVGISGANNSNLISNISSYPITFKNSTLGASRPYYGDSYCTETYRNGNYPYSINATDPMTIMAKVDMSINSSGINNYNSLALCAFITNVRCSRVYTNSVDLQPNIYCSVPLIDDCTGYYFNVGSTVPNTYSYTSTRCYANTTAVIDAKLIKGENIVS